MIKTTVISKFLRKKGVDINKQILWLGKSGIPEDIAIEAIAEAYVHLKSGGKEHLNKENYPEGMQHLFEKDLPDDFWIDRYVLEVCKKKKADVVGKRMAESAAAKTEIMSHDIAYYLKLLIVWAVLSGTISILFDVYCESLRFGWINV